MTINISKSELMFDIRSKSHMEVSGISDAESRYKVEAGSEKTDEIERCIWFALSKLAPHIDRYLDSDMSIYAVNTSSLPSTISFELLFSARRLAGKAQPLASAIHAFLVDGALARFYGSVAQNDLAASHEKKLIEDAAIIEQLVYTKRPPIVVSRD